MSYKIGQYRFESESACLLNISDKARLLERTTASVVAGGSFRDTCIRLSGESFNVEKVYHLYLKIPQDMNYDSEFTLKLMGTGTSTDDLSRFQTIDRIYVPKGGTGANSYLVALYESNNGSVKVDFPTEVSDREIYLKTAVYDKFYMAKDSSTGKTNYYIGQYDRSYKQTDKYNDMYISASWIQNFDKDSYPCAIFDIVFKPIAKDFSDIILEMTRTGDDWNIQWTEGQEKGYGRRIPLDLFEWRLDEVRNLVASKMDGHTLSKINVQSHSGLLMAVNGEQIKVGPSRMYELDAVPITNLGIVAKGFEDNFIVNYMYEAEE